MRTRLVTTILTGTAVILLAGLGAAPSHAASIDAAFTITPGGNFHAASAGSVLLKDTTTGVTITCTASAATGHFTPGFSASGTGIGKIKTISYSNCTAPVGAVTVTANAANPPVWPIDLLTYAAPTSTGKIRGMHLTVSFSGCTLVVDGTSGTADNGKVAMSYTNPATLTIPGTGGNLHIYNVTGCLGLFSNGNMVSLSGTYTLTPAQNIISP